MAFSTFASDKRLMLDVLTVGSACLAARVAGCLSLQMAFPNLRSDNSLIAFNRRLQELGWDLPVSCDTSHVARRCCCTCLSCKPLHRQLLV
jgi:hypothetical protein